MKQLMWLAIVPGVVLLLQTTMLTQQNPSGRKRAQW